MKIVKALLILVLTLFWAVISLVLMHSSSSPYIPLAVVSLIYILLVYLVWPLGTKHRAVAFNRFYIVMGIGSFLVAGQVLLNNQCPAFPFTSVPINYQSSGIAAVILFACIYLGKVPASLLLCILGGRLIYMGYTKKPNKSFNSDAGLALKK